MDHPLPRSAAVTVPAPAAEPTKNPWLGLAVLLTGAFMAVMDVFIVNVAIPAMRLDLGADDADIQLVIAGYSLAYAVALITGGRLGDLYGRRRLYVLGLAGFTLASLLCGLAPTAETLIAARVLQGLGAAAFFPQVFALVRVSFAEPQARAQAFAILGAVLGASALVGQVLGGLIVEADLWGLSWRPIFLVNLPLGLAAILAAPRFLGVSRAPAHERLDPAGALLSALGLGLLLYPLVVGREQGWPPVAFLLLGLSLPVLAFFVWHQHRKSRRRQSPLMDTGLFANRAFSLGVFLVLVIYTTLIAFFLCLTLLLQAGLGFSPAEAGLLVAPPALAFLIASLVAGRLTYRHGIKVLRVGAGLAALGMALVAAVAWRLAGELEGWELLFGLLVQAFGQGLLMTPLINVILSNVEPAEAGAASGFVSTMQQVGSALGVALVGLLFFVVLRADRAAGLGIAASHAEAFAAAALYNVVALTLVFLLLARLGRRQRG